MFFGVGHNINILDNFLRKTQEFHTANKEIKARLSLAKEIIENIHKSPEEWDKHCSFNIKNIGDQFLTFLREFNPAEPIEIDEIYLMSYRFLCEYDFLCGRGISMELKSIKDRIEYDNIKTDSIVKSRIIYASYMMPASITKEFINDENIRAFKDFEQTKIEAEKLNDQWNLEIKQKQDIVEALKDKLDEYNIGFNFVGLHKGFSDLASKKEKESSLLFRSLICMGILIILPLIFEIKFAASEIYDEKSFSPSHLAMLIPLISIEIILIYFFRIILINHRSVNAQIIQIDLRKTLCQFIQSYAVYSAEIKNNDSAALEKFENLIFSGILSDPEKLPSTFDGLDQISKLIKSTKNP